MRRVVLGTAGHIDHGKTTLVKALTGTDTDRLPEEKARGITIDLGFAHLQLGDLDVGIVDVPGHEGLIRNMLAGATGLDAVLLVVAADEGVMPQTREHLAITQLLGVQRVVIALTKCDAVDAEWLELVQADVSAFVASAYPDAPVIAISAVTGIGLTELSLALQAELAASTRRRDADLFRMPIDRVFTVRGTGTVVTGTVWSGRASTQQRARLLPSGHAVRIRGVQTHGSAVESASAGERAAFALVGIDRHDITRGDVLVTDDVWRATQAVTARLQLLPGVDLKQRQRVRVHLGTAEVMARAVILDGVFVQLRLEQPMLARVRDRFVLRSYSPIKTIGGGTVAELRARRRLTPVEQSRLATLLDGEADARIHAAIHLAQEQGTEAHELQVTAGVTAAEVADFATSSRNDVVRAGDVFYPAAMLEAAITSLCAIVAAHHAAKPLAAGIERAQLISGMAGRLAEAALEEAERRGLLVSVGSFVAQTGFAPAFSGRQQSLSDQLMDRLRSAGLSPPTLQELGAGSNAAEVRAVLRHLEAQGEVIGVAADLYLYAPALAQAIHAVKMLGAERALSAAEFKAVLPVSRKYLIPILEYLDRTDVTRREGDLRWVQRQEPQNLLEL